jgi:hypothetical protein
VLAGRGRRLVSPGTGDPRAAGRVARFYGNLIGVKYGEPFVVKETMQVDDIVNMGVRSI